MTTTNLENWRQLEFLTSHEVAAIIRRRPDYVRRQCENGKLPATKLGNAWRIRPAAVDTFMGDGVKAPPTRPMRRRAS